jgi:hypothetical protein
LRACSRSARRACRRGSAPTAQVKIKRIDTTNVKTHTKHSLVGQAPY